MSNNRKSPPRGEEIQSLVKGFVVLKAFGPETPRLTLTEVARATSQTGETQDNFTTAAEVRRLGLLPVGSN